MLLTLSAKKNYVVYGKKYLMKVMNIRKKEITYESYLD